MINYSAKLKEPTFLKSDWTHAKIPSSTPIPIIANSSSNNNNHNNNNGMIGAMMTATRLVEVALVLLSSNPSLISVREEVIHLHSDNFCRFSLFSCYIYIYMSAHLSLCRQYLPKICRLFCDVQIKSVHTSTFCVFRKVWVFLVNFTHQPVINGTECCRVAAAVSLRSRQCPWKTSLSHRKM